MPVDPMIPHANNERRRRSTARGRVLLLILVLAIGVSPVLRALDPRAPASPARSSAGTNHGARPAPRLTRSPSACEVPVLVSELLGHRDPTRREAAAYRLGRCGADRPEVVTALARGLEDDDRNVRWAVDHALAELGPDAAAAVPALVRLLADRERKEWASWVLYRIGAAAVPPLVEGLRSPRREARRSAAYALRSMGLRPSEVRRRCKRGCELSLRSSEGIPVQVTILRAGPHQRPAASSPPRLRRPPGADRSRGRSVTGRAAAGRVQPQITVLRSSAPRRT